MPAVRQSAILAELIGTAVMIFVGLSAIALNFGRGSPMLAWVPDAHLRLLFTACCFAGGGTAVVYSHLGVRSGGHLNPATTWAFWLMGKIPSLDALGYVLAQVIGALMGAGLVRALWGSLAISTRLGLTQPATGISVPMAFGLEMAMTAVMLAVVLMMVGFPRVARYTGLGVGGVMVALVYWGAPYTGTSVNPARSLAPAVWMKVFQYLGLYITAPICGATLSAVAVRSLASPRHYLDSCGKLFHPSQSACHLCRLRGSHASENRPDNGQSRGML